MHRAMPEVIMQNLNLPQALRRKVSDLVYRYRSDNNMSPHNDVKKEEASESAAESVADEEERTAMFAPVKKQAGFGECHIESD